MPLVSVIIPAHGRPKMVARAIRSVLAQSFDDFEIILVDDASIPPLRELVASFGDPRIRYVRTEVNLGPGGARNLGLRHAEGRIVAFLDSDDLWLPDRLRLGLEPILREEAEATYGPMLRLKANGSYNIKMWSPRFPETWVVWNKLPHLDSLAITRELAERLGGFEGGLAEDWIFILGMAGRTRVKVCSGPVGISVAHPGPRATASKLKVAARTHRELISRTMGSPLWSFVGRARSLFLLDRYVDLSLIASRRGRIAEALGWSIRALLHLPGAHWHLPLYPWFLHWGRTLFRFGRALLRGR